MPQRVHVTEVHVLEETNESSYNEPSEQYHRDEEMRKKLAETFGPSLSVMKLAGEFFGETSSFTEPRDSNGGKPSVYIWRYYSVLVALGQWVLVVIALTSLFYQVFMPTQGLFFLIITAIWYIHCTCSTTICLLVLPLVHNRSSRFAEFISSFLTTETELDGLRRKTLKGLSIACLVAVVNFACIVLSSIYYNGIISNFEPWNRHTAAVRVFEIAFAIFYSFAWTLPVQLYCVTCLVLERMFETLKKKVTSSLDFTIVRLRQEHLKLCDIVELADKVFSPFLFVMVTLHIPMICVNVYQLIKFAKNWAHDTDAIMFISYLYWGVCMSCLLAVLCMFGGRVNEKAHSFYETLQKWHVSAQDIKENSELMLFLAHVQGEPIGLSVGGLVVINKSFFLTLVGIILSYFTVLLSLPI